MSKRTVFLTVPQARVLRQALNGGLPYQVPLTANWRSREVLYKFGYTDRNDIITQSGREALQAYEAKHGQIILTASGDDERVYRGRQV
jgi:hypothetical protein